MAVQRACDICGFYRPDTRRYGLTCQVRTRQLRPDGNAKYASFGAGGLDICPECWEKKAKPNMKAETFHPKTAPKPVRVTGPAVTT